MIINNESTAHWPAFQEYALDGQPRRDEYILIIDSITYDVCDNSWYVTTDLSLTIKKLPRSRSTDGVCGDCC